MDKNRLKEAIKKREESGFRFDNSAYWKKYYLNKYKRKDLTRECEYAVFLSKLVNDKKAKVLDIATGYGFLPLEMLKLGLNVDCVDKYPKMIETATRYFMTNAFLPKIYRADVANLPMKDGSYDLVTAQSIIEHFCLEELREKLLPEIKRVTKNNGWIFIHVPIRSGITIIKRYYRRYIKGDLPKWTIDDDGDVTHKVWLNVDEYRKEFIKQGLDIEFIRFNFIRSNETLGLMKFLNKFLNALKVSSFRKLKGFSQLEFKILSLLGTSVVFVCRKK